MLEARCAGDVLCPCTSREEGQIGKEGGVILDLDLGC